MIGPYPDCRSNVAMTTGPPDRPATAHRWPCVAGDSQGCRLRIVVVPRSGIDATVGLLDGWLRVRVAAPAVDGRANAALVAWIAGQLGLARRAVALLHGATSRRKVLGLDCDVDAVERWLDAQRRGWSRS
jgi:hypothetical protein